MTSDMQRELTTPACATLRTLQKLQQTEAFVTQSFPRVRKQPAATRQRDRVAAKSIFIPLASGQTQFSHSLAAPLASRKRGRKPGRISSGVGSMSEQAAFQHGEVLNSAITRTSDSEL